MTDGTRIFLPSRIEVFNDEELNFKTFKWMLTHELAHLLFGTFDLGEAEAKRLDSLQKPVPAFRIFEFLEDERVDYLMGLEYPGLERDRRMIMDAYLAGRSSSFKLNHFRAFSPSTWRSWSSVMPGIFFTSRTDSGNSESQ